MTECPFVDLNQILLACEAFDVIEVKSFISCRQRLWLHVICCFSFKSPCFRNMTTFSLLASHKSHTVWWPHHSWNKAVLAKYFSPRRANVRCHEVFPCSRLSEVGIRLPISVSLYLNFMMAVSLNLLMP